MADDNNFTAEELRILAPKQNAISGAFKGSVSMGGTVFFGEKIIDRLSKEEHALSPNVSAYALLAALIGGAAGGAYGAIRSNAKIDTFAKRLEDADQRRQGEQGILR